MINGNGTGKTTLDKAFEGTFLPPNTTPVSHKQLVEEVKAIYAGLVMVEGKCIEIEDDPFTEHTHSNLTRNRSWNHTVSKARDANTTGKKPALSEQKCAEIEDKPIQEYKDWNSVSEFWNFKAAEKPQPSPLPPLRLVVALY